MRCRHGHSHGTPLQLAQHRIFHHLIPSRRDQFKGFEEQIRQSASGRGVIKVPYEADGFKVVYGGKEYSFEKMVIHVEMIAHEGTAIHRRYTRTSSKVGTQAFHHIEGSAAGTKLSLLIPEGSKPQKIAVRFAPATEQKKKMEKRRKSLDKRKLKK